MTAGELKVLGLDPGWSLSVVTESTDLGRFPTTLYRYPNGEVRVAHVCDRGDRGKVIAAPALQLDGGGHSIDWQTVTVSPSIACPDCGLHGWIKNGRWSDVG